MTDLSQQQNNQIPIEDTKGGEAPSNIPTRAPAGFGPKTKNQLKFVKLIATRGHTVEEAAKELNYKLEYAQSLFERVEFQQAIIEAIDAARENAAHKAWATMYFLMTEGGSDRIKFEAARWIAGVEGMSPVAKVDARVAHNVSFGGFAYPTLKAKDATPPDNQSVAHGSQPTDKQSKT